MLEARNRIDLSGNPYPKRDLEERMGRPVREGLQDSVAALAAAGLAAPVIANYNRVCTGYDGRIANEIIGEDREVALTGGSADPISITVGPQAESPVGAAFAEALLVSGIVTITLLSDVDASAL